MLFVDRAFPVKITFPLPLKISLWLLLNLALLATGALLFFGSRGGLDAVVRGPVGNRAQEIGRLAVAEVVAVNDTEAAAGVLARFGRSYGAEFFAVRATLPGATDPREAFPAEVTARVIEGRGNPPGSGPAGRGPRGGRGGPPQDGAPPLPGGPQFDGPPRLIDDARGRFLLRAGSPASYWLGVRVPLERSPPVTLMMRCHSWWALAGLLDLQPVLYGGGGIVVFSILFWLPLVFGITRALGRLTRATELIAVGKFGTRVETSRRDELGALGASVNAMATRLEAHANGQKRFLADVAHELGSPIGRLQVATEILETRAAPALQPHVADVREEVQHMSALVGELLAFTKAGLRPRETALAPVALLPLVRRVLDREDEAVRVSARIEPDLTVLADAVLLERAVANLVRNALRYAPAGAVTLTARIEGGRATITVADEGPGVPTPALARLGEPFFRPDAARASETGGTGLGLAIVRSAAEACGGTAVFRNREPHGFEAAITLTCA